MGSMCSEESALKDKTEPLQTKNEKKFKFCMCDKSEGKCKREKHKEGESCDKIVKIGKNDRHIICKMCRSGKKKLQVVEKQELLTLPNFQTHKKLNSFSQSDVIYDPDEHYAKMDQLNTYKVESSFDHSSEITLGISKEKNKDSLKGIRIKKRNILQSMEIKKPLDIDYETESVESIVEKIEYAIEQHPSFLKVISEKDLLELEKTNKQREW